MRILLTNDDAMHAAGLVPLARWCKKLGDVTVVVPKVEQSGKSHGIELHKAFEIQEVMLAEDVPAITVDSTPADCVRYAVLGLKKEFDLVISGVNRGFNMGKDIMYSGTVGAISEAVAMGIKGIAFSTCPEYYPDAIEHLDRVYAFVEKHALLEKNPAYNINIPPQPKGIRMTRQGGPYYSDDFVHEGNNLYLPHGKCVWKDQNDLTLDTDCTMHGYISVMPLSATRADVGVYEQLKELAE